MGFSEAEHLLHHYPDADPIRVRLYVYTRLLTQKVLEFLVEHGILHLLGYHHT